MKKLFRLMIPMVSLVLVFAAVLLAVTGCRKEDRRELTMVTEPPYPPFEYYADSKLTGIDIDIMEEIARRIDCDLKIQPISFDILLKMVASGEADVALSCITITEERSKTVYFSIPYLSVGQVVVVPAKSPIRRLENLQGKIIGAQEGTTGEAYVKEKFGQCVTYPNIEVATEALSRGKIDALVMDNIPAEDIVAKDSYFRILPGKLTEESYGIAVNKDQPELLQKINENLDDMLKTGWIEETVKKHIKRGRRPQEALQSVQELKIGIVPAYPPYESKKNGVLEGIDVDIINSICDELGYIPSFVEISSDNIYRSISDHDVAISISSITITEERKKIVNFSIPYSKTEQRVLVKQNSAFRKKEDLKEKRIGVVNGTTSEEQGLRIAPEVERYSKPELMLEALAADEVDAIILDDFILRQMTMHTNEFRFLPDVLVKEEYGIAVSKEKPELLKKINSELLKMKQNGSLARIHKKHIGDDSPAAEPEKAGE